MFPTQTGNHHDIWTVNGNHPTKLEVIRSQTFPEDYDFDKQNVEYICGMSVPPLMIKRIVTRLIESGVFK